MTTRVAVCHCGQLEIACEGEPGRVAICHCPACQLRCGTIGVYYDRARMTVTRGTSGTFEHDPGSGFPIKYHWCGDCSATVYWESARTPDLIGVAAHAFVDPEFPALPAGGAGRGHVWQSLADAMDDAPPTAGPH